MRFQSRYSNDPRWIKAKFPGFCSKCHAPIPKGEDIFYFPGSKKVECNRDDCGKQSSRDFEAAKADEDMMNSGFSHRADIYG